jgi:kynurenine formamidase
MRGVELNVANELEKDGWNASTFHLYSHCGTHMDAPSHFNVKTDFSTMDEIPVYRFFTDVWIVDVTPISDKELIKVEHLGNIVHKIQKGDGLLFKTGWSNSINTDKYRNDLPRISEELVHWCIENKISLIGVEPPSVADVHNKPELKRIHELLLGAGIQIVEGLTNLDKITTEKVHLVSLPLKVKNADGAPARVIAIESDQNF